MKKQKFLTIILVILMLMSGLVYADPAYIGSATVTYKSAVNVRQGPSTDYPRIAVVQPDESYPVLSVAQTGWYEIELPDERVGYISNRMVEFSPFVQPRGTSAITIYYRTADGVVLATERRILNEGKNTVYPDQSRIPSGYGLLSAVPTTVQVTNGVAVPASLLFIYHKGADLNQSGGNVVAGKARVVVTYKDIYGVALGGELYDLSPGRTTIKANPNAVPVGYELVGVKEQIVSVTNNLIAQPSELVFLCVRPQTTPVPKTATVKVNYQTKNGVWLNSEYVTVTQGNNTVMANSARVPAGYTLYSQASTNVYVDAQGYASPSEITFLYNEPYAANVAISVPVYYRSSDGQTLRSTTVLCYQGNNTVRANDALVPSGYILQSSRNVSVYIASNGIANPAAVVFTYAKAVSSNVKVVYRDNGGGVLYSHYVTVGTGNHTIYANNALVPKGYVLVGASSANVSVSSSGYVSPSEVSFIYAPGVPTPETPKPVPTNPPKPNNIPEGTYFIPQYQIARISGNHDVYLGPGPQYYRAGSAGNGKCRWFGTVNGYALMGYETSRGSYRIGYVDAAAIPSGLNLGELTLMNQEMTLLSRADFYDDPVITMAPIFKIDGGQKVTVLGVLSNDPRFVHVETLYNEHNYRGFIRIKHLGW
ncbi:MAG: SH3 domain-containing protein [Christensenellales bacterium]|jgi:uncharacterized protein YgiM (DUF1202 family)|nr:SH3 domain-containing protein [Clostridiales bacterium]